MDEAAPPPPAAVTDDDAPEPRRRSGKLEFATRLDDAEDMLRAGLTPSVVRRTLVTKYGCSPGQARKYVQAVNARWREQMTEDVPFRRERVIHMVENHYARAMAAKKFAPAATSLGHLIRLSAALQQHNPARAERIRALGPAPMEPGKALQYARKILLIELEEVANNEDLDPEKRLRLISEVTGKLGMLYSRSEVEEALEEVEGVLVSHRSLPPATEIVDAKSVGFAEAARRQREHRVPRAVQSVPPEDEPPGEDR